MTIPPIATGKEKKAKKQKLMINTNQIHNAAGMWLKQNGFPLHIVSDRALGGLHNLTLINPDGVRTEQALRMPINSFVDAEKFNKDMAKLSKMFPKPKKKK